MSKKSANKYIKFNEMREKHGLPRVDRRDFMKLMAMGAAGLSIPFAGGGCSATTPPMIGSESGGVDMAQGGAMPITVGTGGMGSGGQVTSGGKGGSSKVGNGGRTAAAGGKVGTGGKGGAAGGSAVNPNSSKVGITRNSNTTAAVATAIEAAGGLDAIKQGDTVCIKPNCGMGTVNYCTSVAVIRGIVEAVGAKTDPKNITIAEAAAMGASTTMAYAMAGYSTLAAELGFNLLAWETDGYDDFKDARWKNITTAKKRPKSLGDGRFDHFISAPILKNHQMVNDRVQGPADCDVDFTCCMKLFVGTIPYAGAGSRSDVADDIHTVDLGEKVAELNCMVSKTVMCVVDAINITCIGGPTPSIATNAGLIIASSDRVACDSVAFAVLKNYAKKSNINLPYVTRSVWQQASIKRGGELGLGFADPKKIQIVDKDVNNMQEILDQWK